MGKAKSSRKGKKAWRANISTEDIDDFYEKSTKDALSGGSFASAPSDSLFFVDKSRDLSVKRKIEKQRDKVLHCDSVLEKNPFVQPVPSSISKKTKKKIKSVKAEAAIKDVPKVNSQAASDMVDIWDEKGEDSSKIRKKRKPSVIPAVEVEPPGCSFNPSFDSHQDTLACAVADVMQKDYQNELGPEPVPLTVHGRVIDEEDMYFLDADDEVDDAMKEESLEGNEDADSERRPSKTKRVTRVELNKRARRKEQLRKVAEAKKVEQVSKEIDGVSQIMHEIAKEDEEKNKKRMRRAIAKQEILKLRPSRLGKYKFEPAPVQVLLSEEITGSLRKLKGCCTLVKDRFKSLEKRGLIAPTAKSRRIKRTCKTRMEISNALLYAADSLARTSKYCREELRRKLNLIKH